MSPTRTRQTCRVLPAFAMAVLAALSASQPVSASAPPTEPVDSTPSGSEATDPAPVDSTSFDALPEGYVRLVDDTGFLTVVVPDTWTDVKTTPVVNEADGSEQPYIAAAPDIAEFEGTFDVPGVAYVALPFTADPESVITESGLEAGCDTIEVQPYEDPIFTGSVQVGTNCGAGGGTWNMIVASPADESFTALVQLQTASAADQEAFDVVLGSFTYAGDPTVPAGALTPSSVPGDSEPVDSATIDTMSAVETTTG